MNNFQTFGELAGQRALITGGTSGIGAAAARLFVREGADVIVTGRDAERGAKAVAEVGSGAGAVRFIQTDLSDLNSLRQLIGSVGDVDILVNNAAGFPPKLTVEQDVASFEAMMNLNLRAPFFLTSALVRSMLANRRGSIINITSMAATSFMAYTAGYSATKAGLASLTRTWAAEFGSAGVRVNTVAPGPTLTDGVVAEWGAAVVEGMAAPFPLGRTGHPSEVAEAILWLASPRSSFITGATIAADGGGNAAISGGGTAVPPAQEIDF